MPYLLLFSSTILYLIAPLKYDFTLCMGAFIIFCIGAYYSIRKLSKIEFFGFNLLFTLSFFGCCYIFPIFIYAIDSSFSLFHHGYDENVITKATCLASIAYSAYICGLFSKRSYYKRLLIHTPGFTLGPLPCKASYIFNFCIFFFVLFICCGGLSHFEKLYGGGGTEGGVVLYMYVLVSLIPILLPYISTISLKSKYSVFTIIFVLLLVVTGTRTLPLALILGMGYVYILKYKIPMHWILIIMVIGMLGLMFIGSTRGGQEMDAGSSVGGWGYLLDLIVNNRNLFDAYSIVHSKGLQPTVFLGPLLAVIPLSSGMFCALTGTPSSDMTSAMLITVYRFGPNPPIGLGTNIVGDVYLGGGIIAVFILFYVLGVLVIKSLYKIYVYQDQKWYIFYLSILTSGIFICRGSFFLFMRPWLWSLGLVYVLQRLSNSPIYYKDKSSASYLSI